MYDPTLWPEGDHYLYHHTALAVATAENMRVERKAYKVIMYGKRYMIVDHTWERND